MVGFPVLLLILVISFALGSIPGGIIIGKVFYKTDIRKQGSGNIGTTNAIRALGKKGGYAVFAIDFTKGLLSGVVANACFNCFADPSAAFGLHACLAVAFLGCGYGHIFSPWLGFRGGKGIAVCVGCLFVTYGVVGAVFELALFAVLVAATKYVSVGSIAAALACPVLAFICFWGEPFAIAVCSIMGLTVVWAHRENIKRLLSGTERRIGDKKKEAE